MGNLYLKFRMQMIVEPILHVHYGYGAPITVYYLGHLFPNYNIVNSNFDNYISNSIVNDD